MKKRLYNILMIILADFSFLDTIVDFFNKHSVLMIVLRVNRPIQDEKFSQ